MEAILHHAEAVLRQHPAPSMELAELHRRTHERIPVGMPSCAGLRRLMEGQPRRFLVLDPWCHPIPPELSGEDATASGVLVVALRPLSGAAAPTPLSRLRDSVRWIARNQDSRSLRSVARICALLVEGEAAHRRLRRKAA